MNWVLYSEADLNNYVTYAQQQGNKLVGSYYTYPGSIIYMCISIVVEQELYGGSKVVKRELSFSMNGIRSVLYWKNNCRKCP